MGEHFLEMSKRKVRFSTWLKKGEEVLDVKLNSPVHRIKPQRLGQLPTELRQRPQNQVGIPSKYATDSKSSSQRRRSFASSNLSFKGYHALRGQLLTCSLNSSIFLSRH